MNRANFFSRTNWLAVISDGDLTENQITELIVFAVFISISVEPPTCGIDFEI